LVLPVLAAAAACLLPACRPAGRGQRPNVLLLTLDTTRADRLGCYGHTNAVTPNLDRLAREGAQLLSLSTVAPITLPAHASLFTGLYPPEHGLRVNGQGRLPSDVPTLAESFKAAGYETAAFVAFTVLASDYGLDKGFGAYRVPSAKSVDACGADTRTPFEPDTDDTPYVRANRMADQALTWLTLQGQRKRGARAKPWFAWVHFYDPHYPRHWNLRDVGPGFKDPYDAEIALMDQQLGRLLRFLEESGQAGNTIVLAVGDHGEGLGDHDEYAHSMLTYEEVIQVPGIIRFPGRVPPGRRLEGTASIVQLAPTLLDLAGLAPEARLRSVWQSLKWPERAAQSGRNAPDARADSLAAELESPSGAAVDRAAYFESDYPYQVYGWSPLRGVRQGKWKYILAPERELYDLARDPRERENRHAQEPAAAAALERLLADLQDVMVSRAPEKVKLSDQAFRELKSLGYLAGSQEVASDMIDIAKLPDPKKVVRAAQLSASVTVGLSRGDFSDAVVDMALEAVRIVPQSAEFAGLLAQVRELRGERKEAIAVYRQALALSPSDARYWYNLSVNLSAEGQRAEADEALRKAAALDPANATIRQALQKLGWDGSPNRPPVPAR
jgi:arylsulfatase A-like enzyme